jgi:hypothetical protein
MKVEMVQEEVLEVALEVKKVNPVISKFERVQFFLSLTVYLQR